MTLSTFLVIKILGVLFASFLLAMLLAPLFIQLVRKLRIGKSIRDEATAPVAARLHAAKSGTPTMGGVVIWASVSLVIAALALGCSWRDASWCSWNFLSRGQTLLPLGALLAAALVGLVDDYLNSRKKGPAGGGLRMRHRLLSYSLIAFVCAWWFFSKLGWDAFHIPFVGTYELGAWYIPVFVLVLIATSNAVNITDGLDGLAGGPLVAAFTAYGVIAFAQGRIELATFCAAIVGALLAFLWFNVPPASFFMGDTGAMSLGTTLGVIAMLTNQPLLLPIIGLPFVIETLSVILQLLSKKVRKKKIFKSAPIHHHLEASGWTEPQIVLRTWIISFFSAGVGVILALKDRL